MRFRIGRHTYIAKRVKIEDGSYGLCESEDRKQLSVHKELEGKEAWITLVHELFHGECAESGIRQTPGWTLDKEEMLAEMVGQMVWHHIIDKLPKVKKFLAKRK